MLENNNGNTGGFQASNSGSLPKLNIIAVANSSHDWLRELSRWVTGSLLEANLSVVLSLEELEDRITDIESNASILVDISNLKIINYLISRNLGVEARTFVISRENIQPTIPSQFTNIQSPFTPLQLVDLLKAKEVILEKTSRMDTLTSTPYADVSYLNPSFDSSFALTTDWKLNSADINGFQASSKQAPRQEINKKMIGIVGVPGTGCSTVAMSLAQSLGVDYKVLLVDLCADGDLAMYHDIDRGAPSLGELMASAMLSGITKKYLRNFYQPIVTRNYQLLAGIKRQEEVLTFRPSHVRDLFDTVKEDFDYVIFDMDSSLRSPKLLEAISDGSTTIASETVLDFLDLIVITLSNDLKGVHSGLRIAHRLMLHGFDSSTISLITTKSTNRLRAHVPSATRNLVHLIQEVAKDFPNSANGSNSNHLISQSQSNNKIKVFSSRFDRSLESINQSVKPLPKHLTQSLKQWVEGQGKIQPKYDDSPSFTKDRIMPGDLGIIQNSDAFDNIDWL